MKRETRRWVVDATLWIAGAVAVAVFVADAAAGERKLGADAGDAPRMECGSWRVACRPPLAPRATAATAPGARCADRNEENR